MPTVNDPTFESDCLDTRNGKYAYMVDADLSTAFVPAKETGTLNYTVSDNNNVNVIKIIQGADAISNATVKARILKNPDKWITLGTLAQTVSRHMMRQLQQVRKYMTANMQAKEALTAQYLQLKMQWQTKS